MRVPQVQAASGAPGEHGRIVLSWILSLTPVTTVALSPSSTSLPANAQRLLTAVAYSDQQEPVPYAALSWSSSDPSVASVAWSTNGTAVITGRSLGSATITVTSGNGVSTSLLMNVVLPEGATLEVTPAVSVVEVGATQQIQAQIYDANHQPVNGGTYTWGIGDPSVATVISPAGRSATLAGIARGASSLSAMAAGLQGNASVQVTPSTILIQDSFNDADETLLSSHWAEVNRFSQFWIVNGPQSVIRSGAATPLALDPASIESTALIEAHVANGSVGADWLPAPAASTVYGYAVGGLVFRAIDERNYYVVGYGIAGGGLALGRVQAGEFIPIADAAAPFPARAQAANRSHPVWICDPRSCRWRHEDRRVRHHKPVGYEIRVQVVDAVRRRLTI